MIDYYKFLKIDELRNCSSKEECRDRCIRFFNNIYSYHYQLEYLKCRKDNSEYYKLYKEFSESLKEDEIKGEDFLGAFLCCYSIEYKFVLWYMYKNRFNSNVSRYPNIINYCLTGFDFKKCNFYDKFFHDIESLDIDFLDKGFGDFISILSLLNNFVLHTVRSVTRSYNYISLKDTDLMKQFVKINFTEFLISDLTPSAFEKSHIKFKLEHKVNESLQRNLELKRILKMEGGEYIE